MSGRLIILPKKTYCPWNPQSIERVLRDERIEKERVEAQEKQERLRVKHGQIKNMKARAAAKEEGNQSLSTSTSTSTTENSKSSESKNTEQQHVNLFEAEEQEFQRDTIERAVLGADGTRNNSSMGNKGTQAGILPVFLTDKIPEESKKESRPFYAKKDCLTSRVDGKLKANIDPMRDFHSTHANANVCNEGSASGSASASDEENVCKSTHECPNDRSRSKKRKRDRRRRDRIGHEHTGARSKIKSKKKKSRKQERHESSPKKQRSSTTTKFQEMMERQRLRDENESKRESRLRTT